MFKKTFSQAEEKKLVKHGKTLPLENVEYGILGGGCFVKKSHVEIILQLEKSVYRQGQIIRAHVEVSVEQGRHLFFISQFPESRILLL